MSDLLGGDSQEDPKPRPDWSDHRFDYRHIAGNAVGLGLSCIPWLGQPDDDSYHIWLPAQWYAGAVSDGERFLRERGKEIWAAFGADALSAGSRALVHEACRLADTLDRLDAILGGRQKEWCKVELNDLGEITLSVDPLLSERRQQALAFKMIMQEIRTAGIQETGGQQVKPDGRVGIVDELKRRRELGAHAS